MSRRHEIWDGDRVNHYIKEYGHPLKPEECRMKNEYVFTTRVEATSLVEGKTVMDVGCGMGHLAAVLPATYEYRGVDNSGYMLEAAKRFFPRKDFRHGDIYDLSSHDAADTVVCLYLLIHLPDLERPLAQLWDRTKKALVFTLTIRENVEMSHQKIKDKILIYHPYTWGDVMRHVDGLGGRRVYARWDPSQGGCNVLMKVLK